MVPCKIGSPLKGTLSHRRVDVEIGIVVVVVVVTLCNDKNNIKCTINNI